MKQLIIAVCLLGSLLLIAINASANIGIDNTNAEEKNITGTLTIVPSAEAAVIRIKLTFDDPAIPIAFWGIESRPGKFFTKGISIDGYGNRYIIVVDLKKIQETIGIGISFGLQIGCDTGEYFSTKEIIVFSLRNPVQWVPAMTDEVFYLPKKNTEVEWQP
ncbi:MAG: hypothetical protein M0P97_01620 [Candidatus Moranbacteria bacterium]|jgi:hypothetical protein|nr:hypothetical protein [Candidatus Moranbacteria bacterium]